MIAQIGEVLATYWRRAISSRFAMLAAIIPLLGIVEAVLVEKKQIAMALWMGIFGPALVALHFKQQIIQIQQRRIPNAVAPHVIVVVGFLVLWGVALPAARMAIGIWSWGALGFVVALTAMTFSLFAVQSARLLVLIIPLIFLSVFSSVQHWLEELCERRHEAFGLPLLAAGACGIAATLLSLLQMSEEDAGFFGWLDRRSYERYELRTDLAPGRQGFWEWLVSTLMARAERQAQLWPQWGRGSQWQRIRLWCAGHRIAFPLQLFTCISAYLFLFGVSVNQPAGQRAIVVKGNVSLILFFPVWTAAGAIWQQRKTGSIELLRPVGRSRLLIDTGLAYAYRMAVEWGVNVVAWCWLAYVLAVADWREMLSVLVLTAALLVLLFGLGAWVVRYIQFTTFAALFICGIVGVLLIGIISVKWGGSLAMFDARIWAAPGIFVGGALITWDAYRRWMRTEMG